MQEEVIKQNYPLEILQIKLGEWKGIYEHWNQQMYKHGPFQEGGQMMNEATWRIEQLEKAISHLLCYAIGEHPNNATN